MKNMQIIRIYMERFVDGKKTEIIASIMLNLLTFFKSGSHSAEILLNLIKIICASLIGLTFGYFCNIDMWLIFEFIALLNGTFVFYNVLYCVMNRYVKSFKEISPEHKKMYVVKNFTKSLMLAILCYWIPENIIKVFMNNCDLNLMKRCAIHYVINDIAGLLVVKKLPTTTIIHHITTTIFAFLTLLKSTNNIDIITLIELYAMFSAMAFCVNFYLGFRVFNGNIGCKKILSLLSFVVYFATCLVNWSIQMFLAYELYLTSIPQLCMYVLFFFSVARDDVILMKWLYNDFRMLLTNTNALKMK